MSGADMSSKTKFQLYRWLPSGLPLTPKEVRAHIKWQIAHDALDVKERRDAGDSHEDLEQYFSISANRVKYLLSLSKGLTRDCVERPASIRGESQVEWFGCLESQQKVDLVVVGDERR
jgi:hypothetical protein